MKKRALMVSLSMAMVLGVAGVVTAATSDNNTTDLQPMTPNTQTYMDNKDVTSTEVEQVETAQPTQIVPDKTDISDQMRNSNVSMTDQMENLPANTQMQDMSVNTQMQTMPMNTQMNDQMRDSQHIQEMAETNHQDNSKSSQQSVQQSSDKTMMGSMRR
ncbi:hypothetical protein [Desulfosporosinus lacus]|uniref:Uncharacterized protein n=1 Tax=Desulfosporosinus lacus DSM 15449 TaxID=1121420 RepID=A0A1M5QBS3_9FIRM|nr:hypothetical protein [Desulfosporosinus lacus]SHH11535.1 hypothetical protein SAMN02746098_00207 [Desulfosporosinus lacus DSM 15449]